MKEKLKELQGSVDYSDFQADPGQIGTSCL